MMIMVCAVACRDAETRCWQLTFRLLALRIQSVLCNSNFVGVVTFVTLAGQHKYITMFRLLFVDE